MKIRQLFNKIQDIELHDIIVILCGVLAVIIGLLNFIGFIYLENNTFLQIITGATGILLLSQFTINTKINQSITMLSSDNKNTNYKTEYSENINNYIENAISIDIYGIELYRDIDQYYFQLEFLSKKGIKIRVLLADPAGNVINMVNLRYPTEDSSAAENIKRTIGLLTKLKKVENSNIEIKKLDYLFPRKVFFINLQRNNAISYISNYTFRLANEKAKSIFYKDKDNNYAFYEKEFKLMWETAKTVSEADL
jgi:hypothetical protein